MVRSMRELIEMLRSSTQFDDHRALVEAMERVRRRADPTTIRAVLEAARPHPWWHEVTQVLPGAHVLEAVRVLLPGLNYRDLDLTLHKPRRHVDGWMRDLYLFPDETLSTVGVVVGSLRAAVAISEMTRPDRARISSIATYLRDDNEDEDAIEALLSTLHFDGVTSARPTDPGHAVAMVLRCPSLAEFYGPITRDVAEALATSSVSAIHAWSLGAGALPLLARVPFLTTFTLPYDHQVDLLELVPFPRLTELQIFGRWLCDETAAVLSKIATLERLMIHGHPISNAESLAKLSRLRALDLHRTKITDRTLRSLATMPALAELDVLGTPITPAGISAFKGSSVRRIGLSWQDKELAEAAHLAGLEVVTDSSEGPSTSIGGAIWWK